MRLALTAERERRGWSKAELARRAKIDQSTLSRIEAARLRPYGPQLRRLQRALGIKAADAPRLLEEVESSVACAPRDVGTSNG